MSLNQVFPLGSRAVLSNTAAIDAGSYLRLNKSKCNLKLISTVTLSTSQRLNSHMLLVATVMHDTE